MSSEKHLINIVFIGFGLAAAIGLNGDVIELAYILHSTHKLYDVLYGIVILSDGARAFKLILSRF